MKVAIEVDSSKLQLSAHFWPEVHNDLRAWSWQQMSATLNFQHIGGGPVAVVATFVCVLVLSAADCSGTLIHVHMGDCCVQGNAYHVNEVVLTKEDFSLPTLGPKLEAIRENIRIGRGFQLIKCGHICAELVTCPDRFVSCNRLTVLLFDCRCI